MRKLKAILFATAFALSLSACGSDTPQNNATAVDNSSTNVQANTVVVEDNTAKNK